MSVVPHSALHTPFNPLSTVSHRSVGRSCFNSGSCGLPHSHGSLEISCFFRLVLRNSLAEERPNLHVCGSIGYVKWMCQPVQCVGFVIGSDTCVQLRTTCQLCIKGRRTSRTWLFLMYRSSPQALPNASTNTYRRSNYCVCDALQRSSNIRQPCGT